jgi:hypothetical protein
VIEKDHEDDYSRSAADLNNNKSNLGGKTKGIENFGRIIFHSEDVDKLYSYMQHDECISQNPLYLKINLPMLPGGKRFFHIREPNGYQLSFAQPL